MRRWTHPSENELANWLADQARTETDLHIDSCDKCAKRLERLDNSGEVPVLAMALGQVTSPDGGLEERLSEAVSDRVKSREAFNVMAGLLISGLETTKILVTEEAQ